MALLGGALAMEARGINKRKPLGILIALLIIGAAVGLAVRVAFHTKLSTDDASIDAEVIHVASAVGGRIIELPIMRTS
jgi:membrane fusion protein, multidrug efflux system